MTVYVWHANIGMKPVLVTPYADPTAAYFDVFGNVCEGDVTPGIRVNGHTEGRFTDRCYAVKFEGDPKTHGGRLSDVWAAARDHFGC